MQNGVGVFIKQFSRKNLVTSYGEEDNLYPHRPPCEYLSEYTSRGKPKIPPADRIPMDPRIQEEEVKSGVQKE